MAYLKGGCVAAMQEYFRSELRFCESETGESNILLRETWLYPNLYRICIKLSPEPVVETGVNDGLSSVFFLSALNRLNKGHLYSIDLSRHAYARGERMHSDRPLKDTGWLVPDKLKSRWSLQFGASSDLLPSFVKALGTIDVFFHDSEHTYENMMFDMMFEYKLAWNHLRSRVST